MPTTYNLPLAQIPGVIDGVQDFALFLIAKKQHASVGETIVFNGLQGDFGKMGCAEAACVLRARITLSPEGLLRVAETGALPAGEPVSRLLTAAEQGAYQADAHRDVVAQRLGFADWPALYAAEKARAPNDRRRAITRELVAWTDAKAIG